ncbi:TorD/DmsD family molecular chaperone [Maridesulfovibrio frigidus]|uniref:TorD/DmsD family molecular chaperone n=1 Tax=Maridesulfovibrio frigidus TaxID=340956 RepID=UPI0004E12AF3|nr:molecular chaperone TorD family protein [Maridesulfovibrio frigidus]
MSNQKNIISKSNESGSEGATPTQIYLLNCLEICTIIFRGFRSNDNKDECRAVLEDGLPALASPSENAVQPLTKLATAILDSIDNSCSQEEICVRLETDYVNLFINNIRGITAPLYESCYEPGSARIMREPALAMRDKLEQYGLKPSGILATEPPDHLCIELEYLFVLLIQAWGSNDSSAEIKALKFGQEMLLWTKLFREKLGSSSSTNSEKFYTLSADFLIGVLNKIIGE